MPTLSPHLRHLSRTLSRSGNSVVCSVVIGGVTTAVDKAGLPLRGLYSEREFEHEQQEGPPVTVNVPVVSFCLADLPALPVRGRDKVVFDDGAMVVQNFNLTGGGMIDVALIRKA